MEKSLEHAANALDPCSDAFLSPYLSRLPPFSSTFHLPNPLPHSPPHRNSRSLYLALPLSHLLHSFSPPPPPALLPPYPPACQSERSAMLRELKEDGRREVASVVVGNAHEPEQITTTPFAKETPHPPSESHHPLPLPAIRCSFPSNPTILAPSPPFASLRLPSPPFTSPPLPSLRLHVPPLPSVKPPPMLMQPSFLAEVNSPPSTLAKSLPFSTSSKMEPPPLTLLEEPASPHRLPH